VICSVKLFAVARQRVGRSAIEVDLPPDANVARLRAALIAQYPVLAEVVAHARLAIDSEYAGDSTLVPANAEIALIPPVSGG
jgi:molybdopterin converting factor small subunit